jgi:FkbM family methyltransferase
MGKRKRNEFLNKHKIRPSSFFLTTALINKNGITAFARRNSDDYELLFSIREQEIFEHLDVNPGEVFVDIGANVGYYTLRALTKYQGIKVAAIEAHPSTFEALKKNIEVNHFDAILINNAVFHTRQQITLYEHGGWSGISSIYRKSDKGILVNADTIDNILAENNISRADVIKMDIEGAEVDALNGASKTMHKCRKIIVEIHNNNFEKVRSILTENHFDVNVLADCEFIIGTKVVQR